MIKEISSPERRQEVSELLLEIWKSAVSATHLFLTAGDIDRMIPEVKAGIHHIEHLFIYIADDSIHGFIGIADEQIEMLLVDDRSRGEGIGKALVTFVLEELNVKYVDVNEQNEQGAGFYEHLGFVVKKRDELDAQGRPFPILHLEIGPDIKS